MEQNEQVLMLKLSSGEEVITKVIGQLVDKETDMVYLKIDKPYLVMAQPLFSDDNRLQSMNAALLPWFMTSNKSQFELAFLNIMCVVEPDPELYNKYIQITTGLVINSGSKIVTP